MNGNATREWRCTSGALVLCLVAAAIALPATAQGAGRVQACSSPKYPGVGYFTSLKVTGTSCATGRKLEMAYYRCRIKHGIAGKCHQKVLGFTCTETRMSIPTEIDARVICRSGRVKIVHTYQQDT